MAEKSDLDTKKERGSASSQRGSSSSARRASTATPGVPVPIVTEPPPPAERTLEVKGAAARVIARAARAARALDSTLDAGARPATTPPTSSDRLAMLAAHLPSVPRDAYEVGRQVAKGGIGRVMMARDQRLDRPVAIKELLVWNEAQEQRFVREALLTARLQHPAIVPIYEAGRWPDGEPFYAMRLVSGRTLSDLIDERETLAGRLALLPHVITAAQAIAYAHSQRILHRDLKPANVLVGEFGETIVIDWGLAKGLAEEEEPRDSGATVMSPEGLTVDGAVVGTPAYMPPEQAAGAPVDERADVYAIGAMLYHLIAAAAPYDDVPWDKLLATIAAEPPRPIEKHEPSISDELCAIVHKAMARDPAARYQTAKELADDLHRFQTGQIVAAHTYSTARLLQRFWRRNRTALSIAATALALVAMVLVGAFVKTEAERRIALDRKHEAEEAKRAADKARADAEAAGGEATARADQLTLLQAEGALSRDPNEAIAWLKTLSPSFNDAAMVRRIAADAHARGLSRVFRGHAAHINDLTLIGDGRRFVTASDDKTVRVWDADTGESRALVGHTDEVWRVVVLPDKKRVASTSKDSTVRLWDIDTGAELAKVSVPAGAEGLMVQASGALVGWRWERSQKPWVWAPGEPAVKPVDIPADAEVAIVSDEGNRVVMRRKNGEVAWREIDGAEWHRFATVPVDPADWWFMPNDGRSVMHTILSDAEMRAYDLWDLDTGMRHRIEVEGKWEGPRAQVKLTKKRDRLLIATSSRTDVYDAKTGERKVHLPGHGSPIYGSALAKDGRLLITGGYDHTVRTLDLETGEARRYAGFGSVASRVELWGDDRSVLAGSSSGEVRLFDPGRTGTVLTDHRTPAIGLAVSTGGEVASLDDKGVLRITDRDGKALAEHSIDVLAGSNLAASPDRGRYAGGTPDRNKEAEKKPIDRPAVMLGEFNAGKPLLVQVAAPIRRLIWHPDGRSVFAGLKDGSVHRITLDGAVKEVDRMSAPLQSLAISTDGAWVAAGAADGLVRLTEIATGRHRDLGRHTEAVNTLAFSRSGLLASGCQDHTFRIWRLDDGTFRSFDASGGGLLKVAFSSDDATLFVISKSEVQLRRWSVMTGEQLPSMTGHTAPIQRFSFSEDGRRIITSSSDDTARLYDAATGASRALLGHKGPVNAASFSADGEQIYTLGQDGTLRVWPDDLPDAMPELRAWLEAATPDRIEKHH